MHTDLPEPVVPAMSRWGIFARSAMTGWPAMSRPSATDSLLLEDWKELDSTSSRIRTVLRLLLGTSIPTAAFPGLGASDTHTCSRQVQRQIVRKVGNLADLHPSRRLDLIPGDGGPPADIKIFVMDAKTFQSVHQDAAIGLKLLCFQSGLPWGLTANMVTGGKQ